MHINTNALALSPPAPPLFSSPVHWNGWRPYTSNVYEHTNEHFFFARRRNGWHNWWGLRLVAGFELQV